jgi:amino acid transporter
MTAPTFHAPMNQTPPGKDDPLSRKASLGQTARAVFWSFFGVRKRAHYAADAEKLNPVHLIVMGIIGAALFIGVLLAIIKWVVLR